MRPRSPMLALLTALVLLAAPSVRADESATETKAYAIGDKIADFESAAPGGARLRLSDLAITKEKAAKAVREAAAAYGGAAAAPLETRLEDLDGLQDEEGALDEAKKAQLIGRAGAAFGLLATDELVTDAETLADVLAWIQGAEASPIVLNVWSPRCPMCKGGYDERVHGIVAAAGARYLVIAGNYTDSEEHVTSYLEGTGWTWKVALDPDQKIVDLFGAVRTPHLYVLDAGHVLRYAGAVDNDFREEKDESERADYLKDALDAVKKGVEVEVKTTEPSG